MGIDQSWNDNLVRAVNNLNRAVDLCDQSLSLLNGGNATVADENRAVQNDLSVLVNSDESSMNEYARYLVASRSLYHVEMWLRCLLK